MFRDDLYNENFEQIQPLYWKRLAQLLYMYQVLQFYLMMGCLKVIIPMSLRDFHDWSWEHYPKMLSWFIYLWSLHKEIIGPCDNTCSAAVIIDGHQKYRCTVCQYKDVEFETDEFQKLVIGCCRSPLFRSHYCSLHQAHELPAATASSVSNRYKVQFREQTLRDKRSWNRQQNEGFGATGCRTRKARSHAYIHRCSRSFGLIAYVTNCQVFISFGEIFRTETLREILHLLFSMIRVAGKLSPSGCYDDGCHLIKYLHKHIGNDLKATDAAVILSNVKSSVDRTHFKNHFGKWCLANMNPADNRLLNDINTEAAEQISWLKKYSSIISALGWRRAPVFLLLLFHMKNLARCHVRPNRAFYMISQCPIIQDVSLSHSGRITDIVEVNPSLKLKLTSPENTKKQTDVGSNNKIHACLLQQTNTDWASQIAMIRKNHNIVDKRRHKKLKRL